MKTVKYAAVMVAFSLLITLLFGCNAEFSVMFGNQLDKNENHDLTDATISSRPFVSTTGFSLAKTTTTTMPTIPTQELVVPEGYHKCPDCQGVKVVCMYCKGTGKRKVEILDPDSGIVRRGITVCMMCNESDPGYEMCETCENKLILLD